MASVWGISQKFSREYSPSFKFGASESCPVFAVSEKIFKGEGGKSIHRLRRMLESH